jgi:hypothetical protein
LEIGTADRIASPLTRVRGPDRLLRAEYSEFQT